MCECVRVRVCVDMVSIVGKKNITVEKKQRSSQTFYPEGVTPRWVGWASL